MNPSKYSKIFTKLLEKRGLTSPSEIENFLYPNTSNLFDSFLMKGMDQAKTRIEKAVKTEEKIFVHGDYDADGITGAALMAKTLDRLGGQFSVFLPERERDGYGVSERAIEEAKNAGANLFITIDCGITAKNEIDSARNAGIDVIVIDHHRISPEGLPNASIILNPLQAGCPYPFKELSAAGLVFKLSQVLIGSSALELLDFAAISTIADIAPLVSENRIIVKKGLEILSKRNNLGIKALCEVAKLKAVKMNTGHIGFVLGPRINAAGRMSSADIALRLLLTENSKEAESLAKVLNEENKARQQEERMVTREAISMVEREFNFNQDRVIVVSSDGWHQGVIGIVASRLIDKYYRPAVVISIDGESGRGSGRSIKGFHLFEAFNDSKDLLEEYGGHELAAGLSVKKRNISVFNKRINEFAYEKITSDLLTPLVKADLEISFSGFTNPFITELDLLEPYGAKNPRPLFLTKNLKFKTKMRRYPSGAYEAYLTDGNFTYKSILKENDAERCLQNISQDLWDIVYSVKKETKQGIDALTLTVKEIKPNS